MKEGIDPRPRAGKPRRVLAEPALCRQQQCWRCLRCCSRRPIPRLALSPTRQVAEADLDELHAHLEEIALGEGTSALTYIEHEFGGLLAFLDLFGDSMRVERRGDGAGSGLVVCAVTEGGGVPKAATRGKKPMPSGKAAGRAAVPPTTVAEVEEAQAEEAEEAFYGEFDGLTEDEAVAALLEELGSEQAAAVAAAAQAEAELEAADAISGGYARQAAATRPRAAPAASPAASPPDAAAEEEESHSEKTSASAPASAPASARRASSSSGGAIARSASGRSASGRSDGALIVDGSLIELLEADLFSSDIESDALTVADLAHLTVPQLKVELRARGRPATGPKPSLLRQLLEALKESGEPAQQQAAPPPAAQQ